MCKLLKEMFKNIDKDNSGTITLDKLKNGLAKHGTKLSDGEIQQLMEAVSFQCSKLKYNGSIQNQKGDMKIPPFETFLI